MILLAKLLPRATVLAIRTSIYGVVAGLWSISQADAKSLVDGLVIGGFLADFVTWLAMTLLTLPRNLAEGCYGAVLYALFGLFLLQFGGGPDTSQAMDDSSVALAFLTFMLVLALKIAWYAVRYVVQVDDA